jgi:hypothetical protein
LAYQTLSLKPKPVHFTPYKGACCALGAFSARKWPNLNDTERWERLEKEYGSIYINGYWNGFDGYSSADYKHERTLMGFADGAAARAACHIPPRGE